MSIQNKMTSVQALTSRAFLLWVGFGSGLTKKTRVLGSGSGNVHIMVLRLFPWSFYVIPFHARGQS